jgi:galactokinase/mevalonate kinase-like predicted kinase
MSGADGAVATVPARAALAGNPSDGYGGAVLAVAFDDRAAWARATPATASRVTPAAELVSAAVARLARATGAPVSASEISWGTTIPRSVGLAGSSAIVIAALRALCACHDITLAPDALARLALEVETEDLGIAAGLQDRIAQTYGGVMFMDFGSPQRFEPLDPTLLPPLVVAWRPTLGEDSGDIHGNLRDRYARGERRVHDALAELGRLAHRARNAVLAGDGDALAACADGSFDARARMLELDPRHVAMIETARAAGAGANYAGSGGAIVCVCRDAAHQQDVIDALAASGCSALAPTISATTARY